MAVRGAATGAAYGWLIGSIAGLGEAALARSSSMDNGLRVFGWAALLDGAVAAGIGALVGMVLFSGKGRSWQVGAGAGAITVGAACAVAFSDDTTVDWEPTVPTWPSGRDIVILALDPFDPASVSDMPHLQAFGAASLAFPESMASAPDRAGALAALFTGRLPPGQQWSLEGSEGPGADVPDIARFVAREGYRTMAIFQEDGPVERRWGASFDTVAVAACSG